MIDIKFHKNRFHVIGTVDLGYMGKYTKVDFPYEDEVYWDEQVEEVRGYVDGLVPFDESRSNKEIARILTEYYSFYNAGDYEKAEIYLKKAADLKSAVAGNLLGLIYKERKDYAAAEKFLPKPQKHIGSRKYISTN